MRVTKAVIPAAGLGTRFLPATKAQPKEMLPLVDKPTIQYVVEEAVRAGITDIIMVTGRGKRSLEDHFDRSFELEYYLEKKGDVAMLEEIRAISDMAEFFFVRQKEPRGLGHAVACAERHIDGEPFAVLLGDDIMMGGALERMMDIFGERRGSVIALQEVPLEEISAYGSVRPEPVADDVVRIVDIVEKPRPEDAPSTLAAIGRYVFDPGIFDAIRATPPGVGGEVQLTDAIRAQAQSRDVFGYLYSGTRYDIGKKGDFIRATLELAAAREDLAPEVEAIIAGFVARKKLM